MISPDFDIAGGIPRVLRKLSRGVCLNDFATQALRKANPLPINIGAGVTKQLQGPGIVLEIDTYLFKDAFRIGFHQYQLFLSG